MKLVISAESEIKNGSILAVNIDRQPVMEYRSEIRGSSLILDLGWQVSKGKHVIELLLEKGIYKKFSFEI
ncbi:MAG: hypothetical protein RXS23_04505 [Metallosphaera yellowstonensis]|jgi:hypothetical protein